MIEGLLILISIGVGIIIKNTWPQKHAKEIPTNDSPRSFKPFASKSKKFIPKSNDDYRAYLKENDMKIVSDYES